MLPSVPLPLAQSWLEAADGRNFRLMGRCTIGRHPDNDVVLESSSVSRHHALILSESSSCTVSDLQSSNGTYLNNAPVTHPASLRDGDELRFGDAVLRFRCTRPFETETATQLPDRTRRLEDVRERACWLLLADVAGFSTLNTRLGGKVALQHFHTWIAILRPLLEKSGAHINSYIGDAIFAWWPAEGSVPADTIIAALAAIDEWRARSPVEFRVVLHHGAVLVTRSERGEELSGLEVNFLFRAEKIAKTFGAPLMLSQAAMHALKLDGRCPPLGASGVEGIPGRFVFFGGPR